MAKHLHHLQFRHGKYYARKHVPADVRQHFNGKSSIEQPMKTDSPSEAVLVRDLWLASMESEFERLRNMRPGVLRHITDTDLQNFKDRSMRRKWEEITANADKSDAQLADEHDENAFGGSAPSKADLERMLSGHGIIADNDAVMALSMAVYQGEQAALGLYTHNQSLPSEKPSSTPLDTHVDAWLAAPSKGGLKKKARTQNEYRFAVDLLGAWLDSEGKPRTIEAVTHALARSFAAHLEGTERAAETTNKLISGLSSYWEYLRKDRHVTDNPWRGKWVAKTDKTREEKRRGFTDTEMVKVFKAAVADDDDEMRDICAIALLTAARREEIFTLKVAHIDGNVLIVPGTKTEAANRYLPIHPLLAPVLARLAKGKGRNDYLLDALEPANAAIPRGDAFGKRFGRFKTRLFGETDVLVFHSWRHTLANLFERAGVPEAVAARMVGHSTRMGLTYGLYSREDLPTMRQALLKVQIPKAVKTILEAAA